jgi:LacI family transcriptional regulator
MAAYRRVFLIADVATGYDREVLKGVGHYSNFVTGWLFRTYGADREEELCEQLISVWHPTGIISMEGSWSAPLRLARSMGIPIVQAKPIGNLPQNELVPCIYTDGRAIASLVVDYFVGRGLKSIAFAGSGTIDSLSKDQTLCAEATGRGLDYASFQGEARSEMDPQKRFRKWIGTVRRHTGLLAESDWFAWNATSECVAAGLKVPDDFAIIGIGDDSPWCELAPVPLTSVSLAAEKIGYRAAGVLDQLMRGAPSPQGVVEIPPVGIVTRRSTEIIAAEDPDVAAALRFINDHAPTGCTVKEVLRAVPMDRRRLERWCSQKLGRSPLDEIQRLRIANIKRLLAETDERLDEIARMTGFVSATVLCRAFQRETGGSVAKYRRQFRRSAGEPQPQ